MIKIIRLGRADSHLLLDKHIVWCLSSWTVLVPSDGYITKFKSASNSIDFLAASMRNIKSEKNKRAREEYAAMCKHIDCRANEMIFCCSQYFTDDHCLDCQENQTDSKKCLLFLRKNNGYSFELIDSTIRSAPTPFSDLFRDGFHVLHGVFWVKLKKWTVYIFRSIRINLLGINTKSTEFQPNLKRYNVI